MKKKYLSALLALTLVLTMMIPLLSFADEYSRYNIDRTQLHVCVNGHEVEFPDAKPYIDANSRTMIPLRFVTEALGAEVTWEQSTKTAIMERAGITVKVSIGNDVVAINNNGVTSTVVMDTVAVLKDSRTYVPIRYVAEALGAYVDYSNSYRTVGIFLETLSAAEIKALHAYPRYDYGAGSANYFVKVADDKPEKYTHVKEYTESFASARNILYDNIDKAGTSKYYTYQCETTGEWASETDPEAFFDAAINEVIAYLSCDGNVMQASFRTDSSCMYGYTDGNLMNFTIRGYYQYSFDNRQNVDCDDETSTHFTRINRKLSHADLGQNEDMLYGEFLWGAGSYGTYGSGTVAMDVRVCTDFLNGKLYVTDILILDLPMPDLRHTAHTNP